MIHSIVPDSKCRSPPQGAGSRKKLCWRIFSLGPVVASLFFSTPSPLAHISRNPKLESLFTGSGPSTLHYDLSRPELSRTPSLALSLRVVRPAERLGADEVIGSAQERSKLRVEAGAVESTPSAGRGLPGRRQHRRCRESDALTLSPRCRSDPDGGRADSFLHTWIGGTRMHPCYPAKLLPRRQVGQLQLESV